MVSWLPAASSEVDFKLPLAVVSVRNANSAGQMLSVSQRTGVDTFRGSVTSFC